MDENAILEFLKKLRDLNIGEFILGVDAHLAGKLDQIKKANEELERVRSQISSFRLAEADAALELDRTRVDLKNAQDELAAILKKFEEGRKS